MTSRGDQLVEEYLRRFDNASVFLPDQRRAELRQEIVEHIEAGTEEAQAVHADAVRAVLDRLGPPADIVASETDSGSFPEVDPVTVDPVTAEESPSAGGAVHEGGEGPSTQKSSAPAPSARPRRFPLPLIGAVATAVVVGVLAFAAFGVSSGSDEPQQTTRPTPTPSQSSSPNSEGPDGSPGAGPETSLPPSHNSTSPGGTPSESRSSR
ncbi:hypothetical protein [Streptomyces sp. WMMB 322]|uniref:HAAS signaling domain-containing protein n=1 Tax=Streptomyces sp. WMMB 322 TaxID=1286821 RepID=UPI0006E3E529|nr:hypothetical protein [Streptomyces sp. WMMB 322]SCK48078.1 hypothetical protein H180DRAFT_04292 [Streptomyces sp. WMMB 322]